MSKQTTISATISIITMAVFVVTAGHVGGNDPAETDAGSTAPVSSFHSPDRVKITAPD